MNSNSIKSHKFEAYSEFVRRQALTALGARTRRRRALRIAVPVALLAAVPLLFTNSNERGMATLAARDHAQNTSRQSPSIQSPREHNPSGPRTSGTLTDQELVALFPPGSCFMAEVDGKKVLIFSDPEIRKRYF